MFRTRLSAMALIAAGAALGYVAALDRLSGFSLRVRGEPVRRPGDPREAERLLFGRREQESVVGQRRQDSGAGRRRGGASRTSSSSWVTTSASGTSVPTTGA